MDFSICDHTVGFPKYSHILQKAHDLYIINGFDNAGISKALDGEDDDDIPVPEVTSSAIDTSDEEPHNDFVNYIVL